MSERNNQEIPPVLDSSLDDKLSGRELLSEEITLYYLNLDQSDPANWPTDDETLTQPPFHTRVKGTQYE